MAREFVHEGTTEGWVIYDAPMKKIGRDLKVGVLHCMDDKGHALHGVNYRELIDAKDASIHFCDPSQRIDDLRDLVDYIEQHKLRTTDPSKK
jgi:hypothetical protein